ncbi:GHKL domain-containing protein [Gelidibacter algens]|uniref:GHKL domain-containing protein n=1 Tax=Gelidibacter algens TaxID=49280 RepID=A0A327RWK8_9FLAO|nr:histidine kinase [Gelidibacter algens]RAJ20598.1 GHKL domain-containing protein [Gelidibacter algens]
MSKLDTWIDNKIIQNVFIWFFLFLILLSVIQAENRVSSSLLIILLLAPSVYVNNLFILPFFAKNRIVFFLLFILNVLLFTIIAVFLITVVTNQPFKGNMFINFLGVMVLALIFASTIKIARDSFTRRQQEKEAELKLLKAQLNPHFLFNTLNNLYGLSVTKSDKLPSLMLKLSDLLRYSLYETKEAMVSLEKEIHYMENYMELEKIRLEDQTEIVFENKVNDITKRIAPMMLIVFVENAFKHLSVSGNKKNRVFVSIENDRSQLFFKCVNTFDSDTFQIEDTIEKGKSGIGLLNVKKRLSLIYPEKHTLEIQREKNEYCVSLSIYV